jgi:hypothetical protein
MNVSGSWKITGAIATLDGVYQGAVSLNGTRFVLSLVRKGEALEGTRFSEQSNITIPISFKKAK